MFCFLYKVERVKQINERQFVTEKLPVGPKGRTI